MPSTPFIGVRISWLMVARNRDLARLAASAESLADLSSLTSLPSSASRRWICSTMPLKPSTRTPSSSSVVFCARAL